MNLHCQSEPRGMAIRMASQRAPGWNGIDYAEIDADQRTLRVYFLGKLPPELASDQPGIERFLRIEGGRRITGIRIEDADPMPDPDPERDDVLMLRLDRAGDFSTYTVRLVDVANIAARYDHARFTFKVACPLELDCALEDTCVTAPPAEPDINYLARDFATFRQLILDRIALLVPDMQERHVPDLGMALVEILAYSGDMLSYYQDAVGTEAYLDTARLRISVRRHARLVDYQLHEGCNARAWITIGTDTDFDLPLAGTAFVTGTAPTDGSAPRILRRDEIASGQEIDIFEALLPADSMPLVAAHNTIDFYTWGDALCCLAAGSTGATLLDRWTCGTGRALRLQVGDVLILEEVRGPRTGVAADADPRHRHAVRLTSVTPGVDSVILTSDGQPTPYVDVTWAQDDALPFPLCLSALGPAPACELLVGISVAHGNVVLVDHGWTRDPEDLGVVPALPAALTCECAGQPGEAAQQAARMRPQLARAGLTFAAPLVQNSAAAMVGQDVRAAVAQLSLASDPALAWRVRPHLLASGPVDPDVVVEIDNDGLAQLRFGDGALGLPPAAGMRLTATYRTGTGIVGNVGADSITGIVMRAPPSGLTLTVRNPLPASGGTAPEPMAEARLFAPHQFRATLARAITADDYQTLAAQHAGVQRASAALVWTGSWYEADVALDPLDAETLAPALQAAVTQDLEKYRRIGHDLHVKPAVYVPLQLALTVCVLPAYQPAHVKAALLAAFGNRMLPDGSLGFFHPDRLSFGEHVLASRIIALAQSIAGVECATITVLQRLYEQPNREIGTGILRLAPGEIAQLDNDPDYPEHGQLTIAVKGGRP